MRAIDGDIEKGNSAAGETDTETQEPTVQTAVESNSSGSTTTGYHVGMMLKIVQYTNKEKDCFFPLRDLKSACKNKS